jgi:rod shape determining protein RodA
MTILLLAKLISQKYISKVKILLYAFLVGMPPVILILAEPDLGTALTFGFVILIMLAGSELPLIYIFLMLTPLISMITSFWLPLLAVYLILLVYLLIKNRYKIFSIAMIIILNIGIAFSTPFVWKHLKTYQQNRILTFIDPMRDPFGAGYQILQAKIAIGSGGFWGKGFLQGTQKNLNFLPEHHTDFIFSVIGEEFGFFGCLFLLVLYFLLLNRISMRINLLKRDEKRIAVMGILAYLVFQIFVNIGMNTGIVPATGIPLPFVSYGGTNLIINVIAVGLVLKYLNERSVFE